MIAPRPADIAADALRRLRSAQTTAAAAAVARVAETLAAGRYQTASSRIRPAVRAAGGATWRHLDEGTRRLLRDASRQLLAENAIARALVERLVDLVVGPGSSLQATTPDREYNARTEAAWREWWATDADASRRMDGVQLERAAFRHAFVDGDVGAIWTRDHALQLITAERIVNPSASFETTRLAGGVAMDERGAATAYYVADYDRWGGHVQASTARPVPAADFLLLVDARWADQVRGEPGLVAVIERLEQLDRWIAATITAAEVAANIALIVQSEQPAAQLAAMAAAADGTSLGPGEDTDRVGPEIESERGQVLFTRPGEKVEQVKGEQPNQQFRDVLNGMLRIVCADVGMPLELPMLDMSNVNYSSGRMGVELALRGVQARQRMIASRFLRRVYRNWQFARIVGGAASLPSVGDTWDHHRWQAPAMPSYDPEAQAKADILEIQHNLGTKRSAVEKRGLDYDEVIAQRRAELAMEMGLALAADGATPTQALQRLSGGIQVQDRPEQQPERPATTPTEDA